jgi:hypothetical protein
MVGGGGDDDRLTAAAVPVRMSSGGRHLLWIHRQADAGI